MTNDRERRWRDAANAAMDSARPVGVELMRLADTEQADLRAEVRTYHDRAMASEAAEAGWHERAEAAEARVARVEALCESANLRLDEPRLWASEVRAALAGPEGSGSADE